METPFRIVILVATSFAALSPFIFIAIREAIKRQRQETIKDLALVFEIADASGPLLIPSFEFVKYKYFIGPKRRSVALASPVTANTKLPDNSRWKEDYATLSWILGSIPFSVLSGFAVFYILSLLLSLLAPAAVDPAPFRWPGVSYPTLEHPGIVWLLGLCAAIAGSYLMALRSFYRAVKNFDFSPSTLVGETIRMLLSAVLAPILAVGLLWIGTGAANALLSTDVPITAPLVIAAVVAASFFAGVMPEVVLRGIVQGDKLRKFKREEGDVFNAFKITPVEIIDGIDSDIRVRLEDHHIHSTQNLAAANPLMLFVETPYGVYQIMDWVAQAQLCSSVGRDKIINLWPLGIRTLFDLERLAACHDSAHEALLLEVGRVILGESLVPKILPDPTATAALVRASIELRLDDPHVQRLRQIYMAVGERLGQNSRRFRSNRAHLHACPGRRWFCRTWTKKRRPTPNAAASNTHQGSSTGTMSGAAPGHQPPGADRAEAAK
ncbi:hypothetical protein [Methylobacterium gossipiicola]|uniref:Uncharacterized protein n=1 Tax=Methylobacterium gossipiicola TaxID=582675 RepID=A0A1I2VDB7_9HYPH|nr:hypothetical protein [Methylobacterium gossipiicola]SFG86469.1 hypothetical protein SAMN05192565_11431 [Methylobacterium gossipiicola]